MISAREAAPRVATLANRVCWARRCGARCDAGGTWRWRHRPAGGSDPASPASSSSRTSIPTRTRYPASAVGWWCPRPCSARCPRRAGLARTAAASGRGPTPAIALGAADGGVGDRARALLAGPPRRRRGLAGALTALVLLTVSATAHTAYATEHRFEQAQAAYLGTR